MPNAVQPWTHILKDCKLKVICPLAGVIQIKAGWHVGNTFSNNFQRIFDCTTLRALCELLEFCTLSFCFSCNFIAKKQQLMYQSRSRKDKWTQYCLMSSTGWLETSSSATTELQRQEVSSWAQSCLLCLDNIGQLRLLSQQLCYWLLLVQTSVDSTLLLEIYVKLRQTRCIFHAFVKSPILWEYILKHVFILNVKP